MTILTIISILLLVGYTLVICVANKQIPDSLSQSVFYLSPKVTWIWTVIIALVAFTVMPPVIEKTPEHYQFLAFIACAALAFVAVCPLMPEKDAVTEDGEVIIDKSIMAYRIHMVAAVICGVCSQILIALCCKWLLLAWAPWAIAFVIITANGKWRTATFWAEMVCFATTYAYTLI